MHPQLTDALFFCFSLLAGIAMITEGCLIVVLKKQIIPLPTRILVELGTVVVGREKSRQQFTGRTSPKDLRTYAVYGLVFGSMILISSFVYLFSSVL